MGLLYAFPVKENESEHIAVLDNGEYKQLTLKTYGLPWLFWGYLLASLSVIFIMYLAIKSPAQKLIASQDTINMALGIGVLLLLLLLPLVLLSFFFLEKILHKKGHSLIIEWRLFFIPIHRRQLKLRPTEPFCLTHFLDSPNVAKTQDTPELKAFQNKGFFELYAFTEDNQKFLVDRHSQKHELGQLLELLMRY